MSRDPPARRYRPSSAPRRGIRYPLGRTSAVLIGLVVALAGLSAVGTLAAAAERPGNPITVDGLDVFYGLVPAAVVRRGHPSDHPERHMHGGAPAALDSEHLIVALFDRASSRRIENAEITASVARGAHSTTRLLESMRINETTSYGAYFAMPAPGDYRIDLSIRIPDRPQPVHARFEHQRR
jgi:hypothetical protein